MSKQKQTKTKTIRLEPSLIEKIENLARKDNRNFNNFVETILMRAAQGGPLNGV